MYVYIIKSLDLYKIGKAKKPEERLKALQTGNPIQLELQYTKKSQKPLELESRLHNHKLLKEYRVRGEWFRIPDNVLKYIVIEYGFDCHIIEQPKIINKQKYYPLLNQINNFELSRNSFDFNEVFGNPFK